MSARRQDPRLLAADVGKLGASAYQVAKIDSPSSRMPDITHTSSSLALGSARATQASRALWRRYSTMLRVKPGPPGADRSPDGSMAQGLLLGFVFVFDSSSVFHGGERAPLRVRRRTRICFRASTDLATFDRDRQTGPRTERGRWIEPLRR